MVLSIVFPNAQQVHAYTNFKDIKPGDDGYNSVMALVAINVINGYNNGTEFRPYENISRRHAAVFLANALKLPTPKNVKKTLSRFKDVNEKSLYANQIAAVVEAGVFKGSGDYFMPTKNITRGQMATVLVRALKLKGNDNPVNLIDLNKIDPSHRENVKILAQNNITKGKSKKNGDRYFDAKAPLKRVQFAVFLHTSMLVKGLIDSSVGQTQYHTTNYKIDFSRMVELQANANPKVDGAGIFTASESLVAYYANPNNSSKNSEEYFQFLKLSNKVTNVSTTEINNKILSGKGILANKAKAFVDAANKYNINVFYLMSHALHETSNGTSKLAKGIEVGKNKDGKATMVTSSNRSNLKDIKKVYNMYGIGARDANPNKLGAETAYDNGWDTPEKAIIGGASFVKNRYIGIGQDTLYKMRWNPEGLVREGYANHQYATHVAWATAQAKKIYNMYEQTKSFNNTMIFDVPKYNNQPKTSPKPTGDKGYAVFTKNAGKIVYVVTDGTKLNFRSAPGTSSSIIGQLSNGSAIRVIGENGGWYKVEAQGKQGWVSGAYVSFTKTAGFLIQTIEEDIIQTPAPEKDNEISLEKPIDVIEDPVDETEEEEIQAEIDTEKLLLKDEEIIIIRSQPDGDSDIFAEITEEKYILAVLDENGELIVVDDWYKIIYNDEEAWIHKDFIKEDN